MRQDCEVSVLIYEALALVLPHSIDVFLSPVRDNPAAQTATVAFLLLMLVDVMYGMLNAAFQGKFASGKLRDGLMRKTGNLLMLLVADAMDALLLGGLNITVQPVYIVLASAMCIMEIKSIYETWRDSHPELRDSDVDKVLQANIRNVEHTAESEQPAQSAPSEGVPHDES
jgi:toxin secretion/phage lysis holin